MCFILDWEVGFVDVVYIGTQKYHEGFPGEVALNGVQFPAETGVRYMHYSAEWAV